jgi:hypothetical protein
MSEVDSAENTATGEGMRLILLKTPQQEKV